jgi:hypothetical protein
MTAMQVPARSEGQKAMEDSLTLAKKVWRQLTAGRKRKMRALPSLLDAFQRLCDEADRARGLMRKYGLNPDDIGLALIYRLAGGAIGRSPLPAPGNIGVFFMKFEDIAKQASVDFLGILWQLDERDPRAKAPRLMWVTEFADDKRAAQEMLAFKNKLASMSAPNQKG